LKVQIFEDSIEKPFNDRIGPFFLGANRSIAILNIGEIEASRAGKPFLCEFREEKKNVFIFDLWFPASEVALCVSAGTVNHNPDGSIGIQFSGSMIENPHFQIGMNLVFGVREYSCSRVDFDFGF